MADGLIALSFLLIWGQMLLLLHIRRTLLEEMRELRFQNRMLTIDLSNVLRELGDLPPTR